MRRLQHEGLLRSTVLLAAVLGLALSGCSSPDDPVTSPINNDPAATRPGQPKDEIPRDDLMQERVVVWDTAEVIGETKIRVAFWAGTHRCFGSRYEVAETNQEIAITVIEGKLPDAPQVCSEEARLATLVVNTRQPVGERRIVPLPDPQLDP